MPGTLAAHAGPVVVSCVVGFRVGEGVRHASRGQERAVGLPGVLVHLPAEPVPDGRGIAGRRRLVSGHKGRPAGREAPGRR
jgi:hypothetical protein